MQYQILLKRKAIKDLKNVPKTDAKKIVSKIKEMEIGFKGDVKRLTNYTPEYRLRVGTWRILFEVESDNIIIYRIKHRKEAYR